MNPRLCNEAEYGHERSSEDTGLLSRKRFNCLAPGPESIV
jgi:hypothetical protein